MGRELMEERDLGKSIPGRGHSKCKGPEMSRSSEWPVGQRGMDRGQWVGWRLGGGSVAVRWEAI